MKARYTTTISMVEEDKRLFDALGVKAIEVFRAGLLACKREPKTYMNASKVITSAIEIADEVTTEKFYEE